MRCHPIALLPCLIALLVPASASAGKYDKDYAAYARDIIPSGQYGAVPIPGDADVQAKMYDALTPLFDKVGPTDLIANFHSMRFGVGSDGPGTKEKLPRKGVTIMRDKYNIPHVRSKTYDGGIWAAGWIAAEDRGLLLRFARFNSRVAAIDVPHLEALDLITKTKTFVPSAQTEQVLARQTKVLLKAGKTGRKVLHDIDTFAKGVNDYFKATKSTEPKWTRNDTYALEALKGQFVGQGGGDEARNTELFTGLANRLGDGPAMNLFNDLRQQDDPDMPASIDGTFPYEEIPAQRKGNVPIDPDSEVDTVPVEGTTARTARPRVLASNELMIDAKHSRSGRPLLVGGPQIGYFYPGLTYEIDMHAPGLVWRGATSAPFPGYLLIGRGPDFATTLTSAGADIIDQYAETLCGGDDFHYMYKGQCREMTLFNAGTLDGKPVSFHSTVHGPVIAYATSNGTRVAISRKRSSYGRDVLDLLYNHDLSTGVVHDYKSFFKAASRTPQTFNSFYIDNKHIGLYTAGRLPVRPASVDPGLITDGTGDYEWKGFLPAKGHPQGIDPKSGRIVNWNNNTAKGFGAADSEWKRAGSEGRVDLLNKNLDRLAKNGKWDLASVTAAMNAGATQDVRAINTVPLLQRLLAGTTAPSPQAQQLLDLLVAWSGKGGSRLDVDLDGKADDPGLGVMTAAWDKIADGVMAPALGPQLAFFAKLEPRSSLSQYDGWYQYIDKDIKTLLGDKVTQPFNTKFCGGGDKAACQQVIWKALQDAVAEGTSKFGTADPTQWLVDVSVDRIKFTPGAPNLTIRWTNRPSGIQQVISFKGHR